ncbi:MULTISPECIES: hypothetical protein [unclassified Photobacterium]|uniref:hypothetical protein n=1 Tax=unclassified Photobacterium TaxID=2628852 RepID=UPI000D1727AC|nr:MULTISPECIES: hypothetical protein [unclassified Photobacterium]PSV27265.1 hypothetical protein C9J42_06375 [Photobacterium sp. GB-56]PSV47867.1 hypothetical protein C9J46_00605 [Photobacterium sp. GB-36]
MKPEAFASIKAVLLAILGTGLFAKAIQLYGLGYYEGFIEGHGFEYYLFPIEWEDTALWAYFASQDLGTKFLGALGISPLQFIVIAIVLFFSILFGLYYPRTKNDIEAEGTGSGKSLKDNLFISMIGSYALMVAVCLFSLFVLIWVFLPSVAFEHGEAVAQKQMANYQQLCVKDNPYWNNKCISVLVNGVEYTGIIIVRNDDKVGLLTQKGALTFTLEEKFSYFNLKNEQ